MDFSVSWEPGGRTSASTCLWTPLEKGRDTRFYDSGLGWRVGCSATLSSRHPQTLKTSLAPIIRKVVFTAWSPPLCPEGSCKNLDRALLTLATHTGLVGFGSLRSEETLLTPLTPEGSSCPEWVTLSMNEAASRAPGFLGSGTCSGSHICPWSDWVQIWGPSLCMSEALPGDTPYTWEPFLCFCMPGTGVRTGTWDAWEEEPLRWCHTHSGVLFLLLLSRCQSLC